MVTIQPQTELDPRFSSPEATPKPWTDAIAQLERAESYRLASVRPDNRPHVTPLAGIWHDGAYYFCTGPTERKALNLDQNQHVVVTTGCNSIYEGLDVVIEGDAVRFTDDAKLQQLADLWRAKYPFFDYSVREGAFHIEEGGTALVFEVAPKKAFGFGKGKQLSLTRRKGNQSSQAPWKGKQFSQTRWQL
jgi:nitroimidazol reductase NimA-like FMN-containing flavoprotein (pyridoxamine 5'-phosphate oxidase superfamily)